MAFGVSKDVIEEIRARCDIVELIGTFVQLKRSGANTYKGLCPFHREKTPSFHVDAGRHTNHCFGCGKGGDVFRFFMEKENVGFPDALHMLAARVGVVIPESGDGGDPAEGKRRAGARERLYRINDDFCKFFHASLLRDPSGPAVQYLLRRGIPAEVAERFKIGYCPDEWTACLEYGRSLGYSDEELVRSGIIRRKEETGRCFDHFKGRLTFAIENEQGRVVGFSARSLEANPMGGKYINTPETPVFKKGNLLYALPLARRAMSERNLAILCEGQLDTIAFHRAGFECAVAPQGTAFTESQARILKRYAARICLAFDSDAAGQKAVLRAVELLLPLSVEIRAIRIPGGKDPDELFRNGGAEAVAAAVEGAVPWLDVLCESLPSRYDMTTPVGVGRAAAEVAGYLEKVTSQVELELYVREAAAKLNVSEESLFAVLKQTRMRDRRIAELRGAAQVEGRAAAPAGEGGTPQAVATPAVRRRTEPALLTMLELAVNYETAARYLAELLEPEELSSGTPVEKAINLAIAAAMNGEHGSLDSQLADLLLEEPSSEVSAALVGSKPYADVEKAVLDSVAALRAARRRNRLGELTRELRSGGPPERRMEILKELQQLSSPAPAAVSRPDDAG